MTKIEEVARAIYEGRNGPGARPWAHLQSGHKAPYRTDARAAIEALRLPNKAMEQAGDETGCFVSSNEDVSYRGREAGTVFTAMIDAILSEGE